MAPTRGEKVWDGRGDALDDARLTTVDGRMADDLRMKMPHFRVMAHVGRQNGRRGWLRVSQTELAERWGMHRNSVNGAFRDLVSWRYLGQRTQHEAGESFCQYKVLLDGDEEAPSKPAPGGRLRAAESPGASEESAQQDVHSPGDGGAQQDVHPCTAQEYTRAQRASTPPIDKARAHRLTPTDAEELPLSVPHRGRAEGEGGVSSGADRGAPLADGTPAATTALQPVGTARDVSPPADTPQHAARPGIATRGWAKGWDHAGRAAVADLLGTPAEAVATALLVPLVGTLSPPAGVHAASYVRDAGEALGGFDADVLAALAAGLKLDRVRDLPAVPMLVKGARTTAAQLARVAPAGSRPAAGGHGATFDTDAWVAAVRAGDGSEPGNALARGLIGRLGADTAKAWFAEASVERARNRVTISLPSEFVTRYVAQRFAADVALVTAELWGIDEAGVRFETRAAAGSPQGCRSAQPGRAA